MSAIRLRIVDTPFTYYTATRVNQGEVAVGAGPIGTILRSCICVGFYHGASRIAAISHVTGFGEEGAHGIKGALSEMATGLRAHGIALPECECFVIGGADRAPHVYQRVIDVLNAAGLAFRELDVLGRCHRKLLLEPRTGEITLYKKPDGGGRAPLVQVDSTEHSHDFFNDPNSRTATGASLLFRNAQLLAHIRETVLPELATNSPRIHFWCAGCSVGMEVYSIAMVVLDWLEQQGSRSAFKILGTDISEEALSAAEEARYPVSAQLLRTHTRLLSKYTRKADAHIIEMGPELREASLFKLRDIREGSRKHRFEMVICDHVLQYFSEPVQQEYVASLARAIQPGGFLYVSTPSTAVAEAIVRDARLKRLARSFYRSR